MNIRVQLAGPLRPPRPPLEGHVTVPEGATLEAVLEALGFPSAQWRFFRLAIDDQVASRSTPLREGVSVTVMLPMGGG